MFKRTRTKITQWSNARELSQVVKEFGAFGIIVSDDIFVTILRKVNWTNNTTETYETTKSSMFELIY